MSDQQEIDRAELRLGWANQLTIGTSTWPIDDKKTAQKYLIDNGYRFYYRITTNGRTTETWGRYPAKKQK